MNDLLNAGLNLRTMEVKDIHDLVADLNFNFIQILQLPGFKGIPGDDGAAITGPAGARGNFWIFAQSANFIAAYSSITTANAVTRGFINGQITTDLAKLLLTLEVTEFVDNDIIVLPSRDVIQFDATLGEFVETGIRFADGFSLSEQDVIQIVNNILNGIPNTDIWTSYQGIAKNHSDLSPGVNSELNSNSIIDIPVSGAGPGVVAAGFLISALKEAVINSSASNMLITGAPQLYHDIVQRTQDNLTNDYLPGIDDYAALAVMQNSYNNGILLGHKDASTMAEWARIYKTETLLRLVSNYNPQLDLVGRIDLSLEKILQFANSIDLVTDSLNWILKETQATLISADKDKLDIGAQSIAETCVRGGAINMFSTALTSSTHNVLALVNNELVPSTFQPQNTSVVNNSSLLLTHNLLWSYQQTVNAELQSLDNRIDALEARSQYEEVQLVTGNVNFNALLDFGTYAGFKSIAGNSVTGLQNSPITFANWGGDSFILKTNILFSSAANRRIVEQEIVFKNSIISTSTDFRAQTWKRIGTAINTTPVWSFTPWVRDVDGESLQFIGGDDINITESDNGRTKAITINHDPRVVAAQLGNVGTNPYDAMTGLVLDATGHPVTALTRDLRDDFYTETEVDNLIGSQNNWDEDYLSNARFELFVSDVANPGSNGLAIQQNVPSSRILFSKNISRIFVRNNDGNRLWLWIYFNQNITDLVPWRPEVSFQYDALDNNTSATQVANAGNNNTRGFLTATLQWSYAWIWNSSFSGYRGIELMVREDASVFQFLRRLDFNIRRLP